MNKATVAISSDFLNAFAALPRQTQGKVTEFINKFRINPRSPGINYEKIKAALDDRIYSVRIDDTYRGIVVRQEKTGVYLLLWVDHHDDAYTWARRKKCVINSTTGNVQVFDMVVDAVEKENESVFASISDSDLILLGIPKEQLPLVRAIDTEETLYGLKESFPEDAYESLEWLINGFSVKEILKLYESETESEIDEDNLTAALENTRSQKSFVIIEGEEELRRIMAEPLEKWRAFLHPSQRKVVKKNFNGPARVLGGAGTGKTVVAIHRAKHLIPMLDDREKILFTTYTTNLAGDIKENLRKICSIDELKKIEVINLDAWVTRFMRENEFKYRIAYGEELEKLWKEAISYAGGKIDFSAKFYMDEWSKIVSAYETYTKEKYLRVSRIGRGTPLDRRKRIQVWRVIEEYQNLMKDERIRDAETAMYECRLLIQDNPDILNYKNIIVDEAQDLGMSAFRLIRTIAGMEHKNDIFIVGDSHQRIYKNKVVLSRCGVNIRGRSSYLRINYRTTEEIRKYAFGFLKGISFDDLDDGYDQGKDCRSLTHGIKPMVKNFKNFTEEIDFIAEEIKRLESKGESSKGVCIVARTHRILDKYIIGLIERGIRPYEIKRSKVDDRNMEGVRVATMHRVKGLEFRHVFAVAVNKDIIPFKMAMNTADAAAEEESLTAEKCLFYVALTRAQKTAYITSYGKQSELIE